MFTTDHYGAEEFDSNVQIRSTLFVEEVWGASVVSKPQQSGLGICQFAGNVQRVFTAQTLSNWHSNTKSPSGRRLRHKHSRIIAHTRLCWPRVAEHGNTLCWSHSAARPSTCALCSCVTSNTHHLALYGHSTTYTAYTASLPNMSDYGDDYSDNGEEWYYVEDEYMAADDLAEHAVASPPPTTYGDEDMQPDWDRFDYFNDLEYASDGYDNAKFEVHNAKDAKTARKRKRAATTTQSRKRRPTQTTDSQTSMALMEHSPIVWRAQADRETKPKLLDENTQSFALLKDWRKALADTPEWARASPPKSPRVRPPRPGKGKAVLPPVPVSPPSDIDEDVDEEMEGDEDAGISQEALMAALQRQLAAAGGPLSGMDPQQLLEFAMRMATDKDAGDEIAGEMADAMLEGDDDEDDADAEENLLSWVAQQRNANQSAPGDDPKSPPEAPSNSERPPTPPSSEANRSIRASETTAKAVPSNTKTSSLKRKADDEVDAESSTKAIKKRVTRSFDAPTAASRAKTTAPARTTRATRAKR